MAASTAGTAGTAGTASEAHANIRAADIRAAVGGLTDAQKTLVLYYLAGCNRGAFDAAIRFVTEPEA
jgi:hypothetical protein